eukprot:CAMPEP_0198491396 /NCGR_PEP_ID=MMETSP1462-20131121/2755_1 /TAXON_ID=1333877 /ORGANISM="Brandtodinium nutriculum, Strain RCC3387" /LENGTH=279 /DNA_ID=CAMNT_0044220003 /DNA_START=111 /DNA_END=946 /DNA_ORIENTATION=+
MDSDDEELWSRFEIEQRMVSFAPTMVGETRGADFESDADDTAPKRRRSFACAPHGDAEVCQQIATASAPSFSIMSRGQNFASDNGDNTAPSTVGTPCGTCSAPDGDAGSEQSAPSCATTAGVRLRWADSDSDDDGATARGQPCHSCFAPESDAGSEQGTPSPVGRRAHRKSRGARGRRGRAPPVMKRVAGFYAPAGYPVLVESLPPSMCDELWVDAILERARVLPSVLRCQLIGQALLVDFSERFAAKAFVAHFSLPCWTEQGAVRASRLQASWIAGLP